MKYISIFYFLICTTICFAQPANKYEAESRIRYLRGIVCGDDLIKDTILIEHSHARWDNETDILNLIATCKAPMKLIESSAKEYILNSNHTYYTLSMGELIWSDSSVAIVVEMVTAKRRKLEIKDNSKIDYTIDYGWGYELGDIYEFTFDCNSKKWKIKTD